MNAMLQMEFIGLSPKTKEYKCGLIGSDPDDAQTHLRRILNESQTNLRRILDGI